MTDNFDFSKMAEEETSETAFVQAVEEDSKVNVPTNTWTWLTATGLEVYQSSGGNGIVYVTFDNRVKFLSTHDSYKWEVRSHVNGPETS